MRRLRFVSLPILIAGVLATPVAAQSPPSELHQVGDHWTAWDPPTAVTEGSEVYIIKAGDSLSSVAQEVLGNPQLWPQIWEQNQYILDSHWIYPGDPLILSGAAVAEGYVEPQDVFAPPMDEAMFDDDGFGDEDLDGLDGLDASSTGVGEPETTAPIALGYEADIYCTGYVGEEEETFPFSIAGSEYDHLTPQLDIQNSTDPEGTFGKAETEKYGLGLGDVVYLEGGRADGLSAGELLTAIQPQKILRDPKTRESLGRVYQYLGRVRVLSTQEDTAIGEISQLCNPLPVGSQLKYFEPEPVPLRRITPLRPVNFPARDEDLEDGPAIIGSMDTQATGVEILTLGVGYLVVINHGEIQDVAPGDIYTIYRRGKRGFPPIVLGELGVLSVFEKASLARILRSRYPVYVGDPLQIK